MPIEINEPMANAPQTLAVQTEELSLPKQPEASNRLNPQPEPQLNPLHLFFGETFLSKAENHCVQCKCNGSQSKDEPESCRDVAYVDPESRTTKIRPFTPPTKSENSRKVNRK
jgi:hypothetical protein